ncbi:MAG: GH3 auxin-responsive promoter family protein [Planctomycetaceae bacterium]
MHILGSLRAIVGSVARANVRRQARAFLSTTVNCRETQHRVLKDLIALNAGSRFSREHGLDGVKDVETFRKRVKVADYEYYRPYVECLKHGDHGALLGAHNKLLMFSLSSGTTSQSKFIPITQRFLNDYRAGWQVWGIHTLDAHPAVNGHNIVQLSSDYDKFRTPGGTPCGNISGLVAAVQKRIVKTMYTVPGIVAKIEDPDSKNYTALRLAVGDPHVGMVMTANPSTLIHLAKMADTERERLIRDIHDGTLSSSFQVPDLVRRALRRRLSKRVARAQELEQIINRTGSLHPRDYWKELAVVAVWAGGSCSAYLPALRRFYGDLAIRDHGLSASEGRMTIPVADFRSEGILDVATHFFEFIPEAEYGKENATVLEAHELEAGKNYFILLTTSSGLYRYNICDVVRCTGFYHTTPMLEFLHKGAHIASVTGEKVSESQIVTAVRKSVEDLRLELKHFTVSPIWGDPPMYQILVEEQDVRSPELGEGLARNVDQVLQSLNCEYQEKRATGRLAMMKWLPLPDGTWAQFTRKRQQKLGGSLEQYKHPCLVPDMHFSEKLTQDTIEGLRSARPATVPLGQTPAQNDVIRRAAG